MPKISVVIPCYCSETLIEQVVSMTRDELLASNYDYEFVLVNDASPDNTFNSIIKLCSADNNIVGIDCSKNLGQHDAIMAGLNYANGDFVMLMDDDMQTHPSQCIKLINAIIEYDCDVVFAQWKQHKEAWWRLLGSKFAVWSGRKLTNQPADVYASNFAIMRSHVVLEVLRYKGPYAQIQGLIFRATDSIKNVEVEHFDRAAGESGYTFKSLVRHWSTVLNFSMIPLRIAGVVGPMLGFIGLLAALVIVIMKISNPSMAAGWPSLMAVMLACSGFILISLGILGEYVGRLFMTVNREPQFVVRTLIDNRNDV